VILTSGATGVGPLLETTRSVPVVFVLVADPVGAGFIDSMARPGSNATGFIAVEYGMGSKLLELLKEIARVTRAAAIRDPGRYRHVRRHPVRGAIARRGGNSGQRARYWARGERDRGVCAHRKWWSGGDAKPLGVRSSRPNRFAGGQTQSARRILHEDFRRGRRLSVLWTRYPRPVSARGWLRRSHPQRRKTSGPSGASAHQV